MLVQINRGFGFNGFPFGTQTMWDRLVGTGDIFFGNKIIYNDGVVVEDMEEIPAWVKDWFEWSGLELSQSRSLNITWSPDSTHPLLRWLIFAIEILIAYRTLRWVLLKMGVWPTAKLDRVRDIIGDGEVPTDEAVAAALEYLSWKENVGLFPRKDRVRRRRARYESESESSSDEEDY
ncbi:hypothetical protein PMZ80_005923 [Knufia obscura]|uniref:Uncharacterized protein n=2 Tax=Knufia TaxID=430999 RepID=A0AAN8EMC4_9EURO|nr:hypothetical protein PMZ80_005923 [Knufia obscura]KAK5954593.1 hypothetical protein OHC33_004315 [Knufia fluminis]